MIRWEIWLDDDRGRRLRLLDNARFFETSRIVNAPGRWSVALPADFDKTLLRRDALVEFWRAPDGGALALASVGLLRYVGYRSESGLRTVRIAGPDVVGLLDRRVVAYYAGSAQADKTDYADDMCKEIVRQNMGSSATDTDRDWSALNFTVADDLSDAPSQGKAFSYRRVLATLQEIAAASATDGTELYFDLLPVVQSNGSLGFQFQTFTGQRGMNRTRSGGAPCFFGETWRNLKDPILEYDWDDEASVVYAGGEGTGSGRYFAEAEDTTRTKASAWGRIERYTDARSGGSTATVTDKANSVLRELRGRLRLSGGLLDSEQARYGVHWQFGDRVTCEAFNREFDGLVRAVRLGKTAEGQDVVDAKFEVIE